MSLCAVLRSHEIDVPSLEHWQNKRGPGHVSWELMLAELLYHIDYLLVDAIGRCGLQR